MRAAKNEKSFVDVVERAYWLDGTDEEWLQELATAARPSLDLGLGVVAYLGEIDSLKTVAFATSGATTGVEQLLKAVATDAPRSVHETFIGKPLRFVSVSEMFFGDDSLRAHWELAGRAFGLVDGVGLYAHGSGGRSIHLFAPSLTIERLHARSRRAWERVASHLAAAHRVRTLLREKRGVEPIQALLDPSGRMHDAKGDAKEASARETLRNAVRAMERARGPLRTRDSEQALELWRGLAGGRWSLVDRWESDGKRFIAAVENRPENLDPRALSPREGAVARLAAEGAAPKDIAYALGISPSNARVLLASTLKKLGLRSRADLFRWNPSSGHIHKVVSSPNVEALIIPERTSEAFAKPFAGLTAAEREVAELAASGMNNRDIARARKTSLRTIANQMAAILRKLGVSSRADILRRVG